ncbi:MAG: CHAT domain-containing protein [Acidobacteria bacterium]|nr:CHAT domain-containing protein [Acidobacteriota bacterium]
MRMSRPVRGVAGLILLLAVTATSSGQPDPAAERARRLNEAVGLLDAGLPGDAQSAIEPVLAEARAAGDKSTEGHALGQLARARQALGDAAGADARFEEAEVVLTEVGDPYALGLLLRAHALVLYGRRDGRGAEGLWRRALEQFERAGRPREQASTLYSLTFVRRDDAGEVLALLDRGVQIARAAGARDLEGQILQRWSDEDVLHGDYGAALLKARAAVTALEQAGRPPQLARALTGLGRVYRLHGSYDLALETFEQALTIHRTTADVAGIGQSMNAVAVALRVLGRTVEAVAAAQAATTFLEQRGDRTGTLALACHTLATALEDSGRLDEALLAVGRGLASHPHESDRPLLLSTRASLLSSLGRREEAMAALSEASAAAGDRHDIKGVLLGTRAELQARNGQIAAALDDSAAVLQLHEEQRTQVAPVDGLKAGFDNVRQWAWAQRVSLLAAAGRQAEAFEATEGARARAFLDLLAARRLEGTPNSSGPGRSPLLASPVSAAPPGLSAIAAHAARLDSTVLSYWVERDAVRIWAVDGRARVRSAMVRVDARRLDRLVQATWSHGDARANSPADGADRQARVARGNAPREPAGGAARALRELYGLLVAPIASALPRDGHRRLTIVPHGPLFRLSFAGLQTPSGRYLIEDFEIHYTPSIGVLGATEALSGHAAKGGALVVAAPSFKRAPWSEDLGPLPRAEAEGRIVAGLVGASTSALLTGSRATEPEIRRLAAGRRVLHFATHAVVSDDHPLDSFLALAADTAPDGSDGRFTAEEVYGLRLDADLVVLSGCRTAGGRVTGDGISGLTRAFIYAGTPSVVATLWDLPDVAGARALPHFYREWARGGNKAAALRSAQLALLGALRAGQVAVDTPAGRFVLPEHPAFWAGLALMGEP